MKKALSVLVILCLLAPLALLSAGAANGRFNVTGSGFDYTTNPTTLTIKNGGDVTVSGASTDAIVVEVNATATLTLAGAQGTPANAPAIKVWPGANLTLILASGTTNTFTGGGERNPGIHVPGDAELTIQSDAENPGSLMAKGADGNSYYGTGAGIGGQGDDPSSPGGMLASSGLITIEGGNIKATGGNNTQGSSGAGIGGGGGGLGTSGQDATSGNGGASNMITITGGSVIATGGAGPTGSGAGLGSGGGGGAFASGAYGAQGGNGGNSGQITILGGSVTAQGGESDSGGSGAGIGTGGGGVASAGGNAQAGTGGQSGSIIIQDGEVTAAGGRVSSYGGQGAGIGTGGGGGGTISGAATAQGGNGGYSQPIWIEGGFVTAAAIGTGSGGNAWSNGSSFGTSLFGGNGGGVEVIRITDGAVQGNRIGAGGGGLGQGGTDGTPGVLATLTVTGHLQSEKENPFTGSNAGEIQSAAITYTNRANPSQTVKLYYAEYTVAAGSVLPCEALLPTAETLQYFEPGFPPVSEQGWLYKNDDPAGVPGEIFLLSEDTELFNASGAQFTISVDPAIQDGAVRPNKTKAFPNELITVTLRPASKEFYFDYEEGFIYYIEEETGHKTWLETYNENTGKYTFRMPADDITLYAEFAPVLYDITIDENIELGMVDTNVFEAAKGDLISVDVFPDATYQLIEGSLTYQLGDRKPVKIVDYQFEMPSGEVEITAQFERKEIYILDDHLYDKDGNQLFNQEYIDEDGNHYYFDENGEMLRDTFRFITNSRDVYYYDSDGKMVRSGWAGDYYFGPDGKRVYNQFIDFTDSEGNIYTMYFGEDGLPYRDALAQIGEYWYYFDENGVMAKDREVSF